MWPTTTGGAFLAGLPSVEDRRPLVRAAMLSGYRQAASDPSLVDSVSTPEPLYEAIAMVRIMNNFEAFCYPAANETAVIDRIKADVSSLLDSSQNPATNEERR